ncbi:isopenicillin N synthase family oxygenase [Lampropedia puyangensis]|uniref:2-oxoglutarate-dependent ethylene/succinate-forming enzyme n=1 Tax=Lampropedia puyangensis TaxID=1330072 RepID=A0A4S8F3P2_9BURK|nr:2-oxoglutarate and iron-dependent oxygenase domain-containing protein [Lampropedia puyangensis]THU01993.1 isopenicillin N synthase family oxygenase [Lampropedia puyangensis]
MTHAATSLPIIDISALVASATASQANINHDAVANVAKQINQACREHGFFYVSNHGIAQSLIDALDSQSRAFFALDEATKMQWRMELAGRAWRGYFPLGGELTSGRPDWKEGLYLGTERAANDPLVLAHTPVHGANLFPNIEGFKTTILDYMAATTALGHAIMSGIALSLDLPANYFDARYTHDPLILFRIFNYPSQPVPDGLDVQWGVGEHTDYGLLTILLQDHIGGLQVRTPQGWTEAPPISGTFICNIGDMLDRMTGGLYRSTPHRVRRNTSGHDRLSFPTFFDPNYFARVQRIEGLPEVPDSDDSATRWDQANVHAFNGIYGDYLLSKVAKVFPQLRNDVLDQ